MKLVIRVGESLADLDGYNRVAIEDIGSRQFLVGIRHSGRRIALFALRDKYPGGPTGCREATLAAISKTLDNARRVCFLTHELVDLDNDSDAVAVLDDHNRGVESEREGSRVERPRQADEYPTGRLSDS